MEALVVANFQGAMIEIETEGLDPGKRLALGLGLVGSACR